MNPIAWLLSLFRPPLKVLTPPLANPTPWRPVYVGLHMADARSRSALR